MNLHDLSKFLQEEDEKDEFYKMRFEIGGEEVSLITIWKSGFIICPHLLYDFEQEISSISFKVEDQISQLLSKISVYELSVAINCQITRLTMPKPLFHCGSCYP